MDRLLKALNTLGIRRLVTIGGDDTMYAASQGAKSSDGRIRVCHVRYFQFDDLLDPVDIAKPSYRVAREYMIRLEREDFADAARLAKLARAASNAEDELSAQALKNKFEPAVTMLRGGI